MKTLQDISLERFLFVPDRELKADVTLVLGMSRYRRPVDRVLDLYRKNVSGRLIFTGGFNAAIDRPEAEAMADYAIGCGIQNEDVLIEPRAANTRENMLYCRELMQEHRLIKADLAIHIVAIAFHMRRALLLAQEVFPDAVIGSASYPSMHYANHEWHESPRGRQDIMTEFAKVARYFPDSVPAELKAQLP